MKLRELITFTCCSFAIDVLELTVSINCLKEQLPGYGVDGAKIGLAMHCHMIYLVLLGGQFLTLLSTAF